MQDTPKNLDQKRADEKMLVSEMIALYCRRQHKTPKGSLCPECRQLHDYALTRIDKCPFMETTSEALFPSRWIISYFLLLRNLDGTLCFKRRRMPGFR